MKKIAPLLVLLAGILWGTMGIYVRRFDVLSFTTIEIVAVRAIMTTLSMALVLLIYDRRLFRIRIKDVWCFLGTGILSILFFNFCYFKAITLTSLSVAAVLLYTAPAIVMVLSVFLFGERITRVKFFALLATFVGCILVTGVMGNEAKLSIQGVLIGLGAGLGYALYSIFSRYAILRNYHSLTITFYTFLFASVGVIPLADMGKVLKAASGDGAMLGFYVVFACVSTVIPYLLYTLGLNYIENGKASIIASVEPVTATVIGVILFHETMLWNHLLGIVLVLSGIVACSLVNKEKEVEE